MKGLACGGSVDDDVHWNYGDGGDSPEFGKSSRDEVASMKMMEMPVVILKIVH